MSAAAELRKLDEQITDLALFFEQSISEITFKEHAAVKMVRLRNTLPKIIAVVEAGQRAWNEPYESATWWRDLGDALDDLTTKLEGETT